LRPRNPLRKNDGPVDSGIQGNPPMPLEILVTAKRVEDPREEAKVL
jgi:hypothetical protein